MIRKRIRTQGDDPDLIFIVSICPLGLGGVYWFEEEAQKEAKELRDKGQRAYVVPKRIQ